MDYLFDYLLFLAQAVTVVVAFLVIFSAIASGGTAVNVPSGAKNSL